jgi:chemotaxis protein MotB
MASLAAGECKGVGMAGQSNAAPVLVKRKKVVAGSGHHGGAWKVAYADFVTAMMAFFLLMWLLNATTEQQRKGLADYFNPTIPVNRISGGGDGAFGGDSVFSEEVLAQSGTGASHRAPTADRQAFGQATNAAEDAAVAGDEAGLRELERMLLERAAESLAMDAAMRHVATRITDEGLVVEIFDREGAGIFAADSDAPLPLAVLLARIVAETFAQAANGVAVNGHVRAYPVTLRDNPVWALSAARAQAIRSLLEAGGMAPGRIQRVTGHADRRPATPDPAVVRNNRIEIVLLRRASGAAAGPD